MAHFDDLYLTDEMKSIFSDETQVQSWLDVEAALARAQATVGLVPEAAADRITKAAQAGNIDLAKLRADTATLGWPILPLVRHLAAICEKDAAATNDESDAAGYIHWGATTQDIMDTGLVLQFRQAFAAIDSDLSGIQRTLIALADKHRATLMAGRTHGQHALPITFGFKAAVWLDEVTRSRKRLAEALPRILTLQFGGAVGTLASLGADGLKTRAALAKELGLNEPVISWHVSRDTMAEASWLAASLATTADKIALEISLLMKTEVGELSEPAIEGRGGSSTMPQKRNPATCEIVCTCAAAARREVPAGLDSMRHDHERGMGPAHQEWYSTPWAVPRAGTAVALIGNILAGLVVDQDRMRTNLDLTRGLFLSEAVMMVLARHIGRQQAHVLMKEVCSRAMSEDRPLGEVMNDTPAVRDAIPAETLSACLDPASYLGTADAMIDRTIAAAEADL